jgi:DnaJ-domain-containing protein 1
MRGTGEYVQERHAAHVEIRLSDGTLLKGKLMMAMGKAVADVLNSPSLFLDFESHTGERSYIAKLQVAVLRQLEVARPASLGTRLAAIDDFEPHRILGVEPDAAPEEIRRAYLRLAKGYHPDCFANVELPAEVKDYLAAMVRRINAAYAALETPRNGAATREGAGKAGSGRPAN